MTDEASARRHRARQLERLALASVALAPLVWGGMHPIWAALLAGFWIGLAALALATGWWNATRTDALGVGLTVLAVWIAARGLLPWNAVATAFEHEVYAVWEGGVRSTVGAGHAARYALHTAGLAALVVVLSNTRTRGSSGRRRVAVGAAAWAVVLVGLAHGLFDASALFGWWEPRQVYGLRNPFAAPFVNENQAGVLWGIAALVALHRGLTPGPPAWVRAGMVVAALGAVLAVEFLFRAHAAMLATLLGVAVLLGAHRIVRPQGRAIRMGAAVVASVVAAGVLWGGALDVPKASVWQTTLALSLERPLLGWGAGAFGDVYWMNAAGALVPRATTPESGALEVAFSLGWVWALALAVLALAPLLRVAERGGAEAPFFEGVLAIALVDLALGMTGAGVGALPLVLVARSALLRPRERAHRAAPAVVVVGTLAVVVAVAPALERSIPLELLGGEPTFRRAEVRALACGSTELDVWRRESAMARPADPRSLRALADVELRCGGDPEPVVALLASRMGDWWTARELAIDVARAARDDARECAALRRPPRRADERQAWSERWLRYAPAVEDGTGCAEGDAELQRAALEAWVTTMGPETALLTALQLGQRGWAGADATAARALIDLGDPTAARYAREVWDRDGDLPALRLLAEALALEDASSAFAFLAEAAPGFESCEAHLLVLRAVHEDVSEAELDPLVRAATRRCERHAASRVRVMRASALAYERIGDVTSAMAVWRRVVSEYPDDVNSWSRLASLAERTEQPAAAERYAREAEAARRRQAHPRAGDTP